MASGHVGIEAAIKPCESMYLKFIPLDKRLTKRAVTVVEEFIKKNLITRVIEVDSLYFVFQYLLRWFML